MGWVGVDSSALLACKNDAREQPERESGREKEQSREKGRKAERERERKCVRS